MADSRRPAPDPTRGPAPGPVFWIGLVAVVAVVFVLRTAYFYLDDVSTGYAGSLPMRIMTEGTGAVGGLLLAPLIIWAARRFRPRRVGWPAAVLAHLATFAVFTIAHTLFMAFARRAIAPRLDIDYDYGPLPLRLLMEAPNDAIVYAVGFGALLLAENVRARREREVQAIALEREVARAELANLQLQLQPHFLFNALNTVSATMYDDPAAADEMIGHLSDLLRHALGTAGRQEMPLGDELRLLESYLALARARFGDRVAVTIDVEPGIDGALVPPLLLQPLVENATQHGIAPSGRGHVAIRARRDRDALVLEVENDLAEESATTDATPGIGGSGLGLGLTVTSRRLALLYGDASAIEAGTTAAHTFRVTVRLPFRSAATPSVETRPSVERHAHSHR